LAVTETAMEVQIPTAQAASSTGRRSGRYMVQIRHETTQRRRSAVTELKQDTHKQSWGSDSVVLQRPWVAQHQMVER
jgi:hypothetical protein